MDRGIQAEGAEGQYCKIVPPGEAGMAVPDAADDVDSVEQKGPILCAACRSPVTSSDRAIAVQGSHRHLFMNPAGIVYEIGCFSSAGGCAVHGHPTMEFTWFAGFTWQFALCGHCMCHLGWFYSAPGGASFFGLILENILRH